MTKKSGKRTAVKRITLQGQVDNLRQRLEKTSDELMRLRQHVDARDTWHTNGLSLTARDVAYWCGFMRSAPLRLSLPRTSPLVVGYGNANAAIFAEPIQITGGTHGRKSDTAPSYRETAIAELVKAAVQVCRVADPNLGPLPALQNAVLKFEAVK